MPCSGPLMKDVATFKGCELFAQGLPVEFRKGWAQGRQQSLGSGAPLGAKSATGHSSKSAPVTMWLSLGWVGRKPPSDKPCGAGP